MTFTPWRPDEDPVCSPGEAGIAFKKATLGSGAPEDEMELFVMAEGPDGRLWFATSGGVGGFSPDY